MKRHGMLTCIFVVIIGPLIAGCPTIRRSGVHVSKQYVQISIERKDDSHLEPNIILRYGPESRRSIPYLKNAHGVSQWEYLTKLQGNTVRTDAKGHAGFNVYVDHVWDVFYGTLTGQYYLFHITGNNDEIIPTLMKPNTTSEGCHYKITVESIGKPVCHNILSERN